MKHILKEYAHLAKTYDERWTSYIQKTTSQTIKHLSLASSENILDLSCGTGELIKRLLADFPNLNIFGIDASEEMLKIAQQKLPKHINLKQGLAQKLPFTNKSFDVIVSCNAFHFYQEPIKVLKECRRTLKPNGRIIITDWCNDFLTMKGNDILLRLFNRAHFKTYKSDELETILKEVGFEKITLDRYKINWFWGIMTITGKI